MRWSDSDRRDDTLEARAHIDYTGETWYPDWDGSAPAVPPPWQQDGAGLTAARAGAVLLLGGVDRVIATLGERSAA